VFTEIVKKSRGEKFLPPTDAEKKEILLRQFDRVVAEKGLNGIKEFRHHLLQYCKGFSGSARLRKEISLLTSPKSVLDAIDSVFG
jgi:tRNA-dihydrouridine synthase